MSAQSQSLAAASGSSTSSGSTINGVEVKVHKDQKDVKEKHAAQQTAAATTEVKASQEPQKLTDLPEVAQEVFKLKQFVCTAKRKTLYFLHLQEMAANKARDVGVQLCGENIYFKKWVNALFNKVPVKDHTRVFAEMLYLVCQTNDEGIRTANPNCLAPLYKRLNTTVPALLSASETAQAYYPAYEIPEKYVKEFMALAGELITKTYKTKEDLATELLACIYGVEWFSFNAHANDTEFQINKPVTLGALCRKYGVEVPDWAYNRRFFSCRSFLEQEKNNPQSSLHVLFNLKDPKLPSKRVAFCVHLNTLTRHSVQMDAAVDLSMDVGYYAYIACIAPVVAAQERANVFCRYLYDRPLVTTDMVAYAKQQREAASVSIAKRMQEVAGKTKATFTEKSDNYYYPVLMDCQAFGLPVPFEIVDDVRDNKCDDLLTNIFGLDKSGYFNFKTTSRWQSLESGSTVSNSASSSVSSTSQSVSATSSASAVSASSSSVVSFSTGASALTAATALKTTGSSASGASSVVGVTSTASYSASTSAQDVTKVASSLSSSRASS